MKSPRTSTLREVALAVAAIALFSVFSAAQDAPATGSAASGETAGAIHDLQDQIHQLQTMVEQMRSENAQSRAEMHQLRQDLQATRALLERPGAVPPAEVAAQPAAEPAAQTAASESAGSPQGPIEDRIQKLEDSVSLVSSKIDEQYQTKVETASKYRARLHGIVLMNAFRNVGGADNLDFPVYSQPTRAAAPIATVGATLRQSEIGLEIFGPIVFGAKSSADVQFDFAGGFPATGNGVDFGVVRLQTASLRLDWEHTSVIGGQDSLFISPLAPTSFASLATPAFAYAGNLWAWTPQLRVEHRFAVSDRQTVTVQGGIFDNLSWEPNYNSFSRTPQAGELSGQPAYAARVGWSRPVQERAFSLGMAGYYGRQNWTGGRYTDSWSGMVDWQIPVLPRLAWSGEFYRGRGIGGIGGGIGTSIVFGGDPFVPTSPIRGVNSAGGWTQLKLQITPKLELNGVVAEDNAFASDIRGFALDQNNFGTILGRNQGALGNVVFRPRSDLLFSAELRRYQTFPVYSVRSTTNQVNLSFGILF